MHHADQFRNDEWWGGDPPNGHSDVTLVQDDVLACLRIAKVDGHVSRSGPQHSEDGNVEVGRAARHFDSDAATAPDICLCELGSDLPGFGFQLRVRQPSLAIFQGH